MAILTAPIDTARIRKDFPVLAQKVHGKPLVYLDNAATAQKPQQVLDRMLDYYQRENANIHRGVHYLSQLATRDYEEARQATARFINAPDADSVLFVRGCTEGVNLVADTYGRQHVGAGDEVIVTLLEHHSNFLPWQRLCQEKGATLKVVPVNERGEVELDAYQAMLSERTKLVAVSHVSNTLGTIVPVEEMCRLASEWDVPVFVDGAQSVPHLRVDVQQIGCAFYTFSGHKMFGPTGIGALWVRDDILQDLPPYQVGGGTIDQVGLTHTTWANAPAKFEAGTPHIAGAIGLHAAIEYMEDIGLDLIAAHDDRLLDYATEQMQDIPGLRIVGTAAQKTSVISFLLDDIHPFDAGTIIDRMGVAVRTGHHCTQPLMQHYGIPGTLRASFALYNTRQDVDALVAAIEKARALLA